MATEIEFLLIPSRFLLSVKEHQLRVSQVRSHAARISYKSRHRATRATWSDGGPKKRKHTVSFGSSPDSEPSTLARLRCMPESVAGTNALNGVSPTACDYVPGEDANEQSSTIETSAIQWHWMGGGTRTDPFNCIPGLDSELGGAAAAFDWLCQYVSPDMASINQPFGVSNLYGRWLLEQMAVHSDVFHVMMAALHGGLDVLTGAGGRHRSYALMHKVWALRALQHRLAALDAWVDDSAVLTILYLALLEDAAGSRTASKIHRRHVQELIAARGSVQLLRTGSGIKAMIEHSPIEFTHAAPTPPSDYYHFCHYPTWPDPAYLSRLSIPPGFLELARTGTLSYQTINCIQRIAARRNFSVNAPGFSTTSQRLREHVDPFSESSSLHFVDFREGCPAIMLPDDADGQPPLEKLICLALIRYSLNCAIGERPAARCYSHNLTLELRHQLIPGHRHTSILTDTLQQRTKIAAKKSSDPLESLEREAMIWMWLMAIDTWSLPDFEPSNAGKLLLIDLLDRFDEVQGMSEKDFDVLQKRWFWTDNINGIVRRYICGPERSELSAHQERLVELRRECDVFTCEEDVLRASPTCKTCEHCHNEHIVVAGWHMKGGLASSTAPLRPAHSIE